MCAASVSATIPPQLSEYIQRGRVHDALVELARLGGADFDCNVLEPDPTQTASSAASADHHPIHYGMHSMGSVACHGDGFSPHANGAARVMAPLLEHMLDRELAVTDLAQQMMTSYEELNLMYELLPSVVTRVEPFDIGKILVDETAQTLQCRRVSLLVLDESHSEYKVLASRGLPREIQNVSLPVADSITAHALWDDDLLTVNDISERPDLAQLSRGDYRGQAFAVVRVPLIARGDPLGFLTVTDRVGDAEFTARDRKLLGSLSALGASALLNCRLHAIVKTQMISTVHALASAVDAKDQYTHDHAGRVAQICVAIAREMGITEPATLEEVELAGLLHDIGKIGVPDAILSKPSALTSEEFRAIQEHAAIGARIIGSIPGLEGVTQAVLHHHERHDGLGYPRGLAGSEIPLTSSLISVSDVFDVLTSDRPYRKGGDAAAAIKELNRCKGTQFVAEVVEALTTIVEREGTVPLAGSAGQPQPRLATPVLRSPW